MRPELDARAAPETRAATMSAGATAPVDRLRRAARLAYGLPRYLRDRLDVAGARSLVAARVAQRDERFLDCTRRLIYGDPAGATCRLLAWAGCSYGDLERGVRRDGLEVTLGALRAAGVHLSADEVKGRVSITRRGLEIATGPASFDHPFLGGALAGRTSGSRGGASRALYDLEFFAEEAADELLLYASHGALDAPCGFWMPGPPSISGLHNLLVELRCGRAPRRFFSHLAPSRRVRLAMMGLRAIARRHGRAVPPIEPTTSDDALAVARWMRATLDEGRGCVLKAFASSAVRVAAAAHAQGIPLDGALFLTGGEPLTETRRRFLLGTGARAHARYVTTETGFVAASCGGDASGTTMHLHADRLAVIEGDDPLAGDARRLLFTTLSPHNGKVLLNADLGDSGRLLDLACDCPLGEAGLVRHVAAVRPRGKVTVEGMTVDEAVLEDAVACAVEASGGAPDSCQLREEQDATGIARLVLVLGPTLASVDASTLVARVLAELERRDGGAAIAARFWRDTDTLRVSRGAPEGTAGAKLPGVLRVRR